MSQPHLTPEEALEEMDSCVRVSRAYRCAGERCAEIDPDAIARWRVALAGAMRDAEQAQLALQEGQKSVG